MQNRDDDLFDLDALLGQARDQRVAPSPALLDRVLADAVDLQPAPRPIAPPQPRPERGGWLDGLFAVFGGAGAMAGMGSAAVAGLMLGFLQPAGLSDMTTLIWGQGSETLSLMPTVDTLIAEDTP